MVNAQLFDTRYNVVPVTRHANEAGGKAYQLPPDEGLAQLVATGTLHNTFHAAGKEQLNEILHFAGECDPLFVAQAAVMGRKQAFMKDTPALLLAHLATRDVGLLKRAWPHVIDNGKMLRNFCQIIRSNTLGRKSFGTAIKKLIAETIVGWDLDYLFRQDVGNKPSIVDVIKMVHPKPKNKDQSNLFAYLTGRRVEPAVLTGIAREYELFKWTREEIPNVPFQKLDSLGLTKEEWTEVARNAPWQMTRMNLNTFKRHGVFETQGMGELIAMRLRDPDLIKKSRCFPYQLFMAYAHATDVPRIVIDALHDAVDAATGNIPAFSAPLVICVDVSGSMSSPVTGSRGRVSSAARCVDVAALFASSLLKKSPESIVIPFDTQAHCVRCEPRDSVFTLAAQLSRYCGGGTNCSAPLEFANEVKYTGDVVFISDNQSWFEGHASYSGGTRAMEEWATYKRRNKSAKMVCIDLQPYRSVQHPSTNDILNIGGFSDQVFSVVSEFFKGSGSASFWVEKIKQIAI